MDKREKLAIYSAIALVLVFFGAVVIASTGLGINVPDCVTDVKPFKKSELIPLGEKHYQLHSIARMWSFEPAELEIPAGSQLDIYLTSADVTHGFQVEKKNVNMMAVPGQITFASVSFDEDEVGTYAIICHEYCGLFHHNMVATIRVRPAEDIVPAQDRQATNDEQGNSATIAEGGAGQ